MGIGLFAPPLGLGLWLTVQGVNVLKWRERALGGIAQWTTGGNVRDALCRLINS